MNENKKKSSEQSGFYTLIQEITAKLVSVRGEEINAAVDDCLEQIGEYFHVNQVGLGQWSNSGKILPSLQTWGDRPVSDYLTTVGPGPETFAYFCQEGSLIWNCLDDLKELPQFQEHARQVGAIAGALWLHRNFGSHTQQLAMAKNSKVVWPEDTIDCLSAVGGVLFNALYRRRAEQETERLQLCDTLISQIVSRFVHLPPEEVDGEVEKALELLCECLDVDLGNLLLWKNPEKTVFTVSHEWGARAIEGLHCRGTDISDALPWLTARLKEAKPIFISEPDDFPPEATSEREICNRIGIRSIIWVPFTTSQGLQGYIALSTVNRSVSWPESIVSHLSLAGHVFASAIDRQRADRKLRQAYNDIQKLKDYVQAENITLREDIRISVTEEEIIGKSHSFRTVLHQVKQVAPTDSTVLLLGETGTGKGLIARRIHQLSDRKNRLLVVVNCAALPAALIESELFGHEKGAFTGATARKIGRFELADGGTILLDEIGDLPLELQAKLLRILQDHEYERLGSSTTRTVNTRVIAATNRNLDEQVSQGAFRADLYYRLGVFPILVPPLRERRTDIPLLVWFFVTGLQSRLGKIFDSIPTQVMDALISHDWPGNIRELRNVIERAMILSRGPELELKALLPITQKGTGASTPTSEGPDASLESVNRAHIISILEDCSWKVRGEDGAAKRLGLKRTTLQSRMKKLGIRRPTN